MKLISHNVRSYVVCVSGGKILTYLLNYVSKTETGLKDWMDLTQLIFLDQKTDQGAFCLLAKI